MTGRTFTYRPVGLDRLPPDLAREACEGADAAAYAVTIWRADGSQEPEAALVLAIPSAARIGIAWGSYAEWGDLRGEDDPLAAAVADWLDLDGDAWESRR